MQSVQGCFGIPGKSGESVIASWGLTTQYTPTGGQSILFDTAINDPLALYNKANGNLIIPSPGLYLFTLGGNCTTGDTVFYIQRNGVNVAVLFDGGLSATLSASGSIIIQCYPRDLINFVQNSAHPLTGSGALGYINWFSAAKVGHL